MKNIIWINVTDETNLDQTVGVSALALVDDVTADFWL